LTVNTTLLLIALIFVAAAVVGGGLKAAGIEVQGLPCGCQINPVRNREASSTVPELTSTP
jgi:hypothetical protein